MKKSKSLWIYILECTNGHYYTGYSKNLVKRFRQHLDGKANSRYTKSFRPVRIAQCWRFEGTVGTALKIERLIKRRRRSWKEILIAEPEKLHFLANEKLGVKIEIHNFDANQVEKKAREMDPTKLAKSSDPFKDFPLNIEKA